MSNMDPDMIIINVIAKKNDNTIELSVPDDVFNQAERILLKNERGVFCKTFPAEAFGSDAWISDKEELPKFKPTETCIGPFWVSRKLRNGLRMNHEAFLCREGTYTDDCWWGDGDEDVYYGVTHWKYISDVPQEDNDD